MNVYLKTITGDTFAVGMTDPDAIAAAEALGIRVCPPGLLVDGGLGEDTIIDQLKAYLAGLSVHPVEHQRMIFAGKRLEDDFSTTTLKKARQSTSSCAAHLLTLALPPSPACSGGARAVLWILTRRRSRRSWTLRAIRVCTAPATPR